MTTSSAVESHGPLSPWVAAEVRAELGRRQESVRAFAFRLGRDQKWAARRLGRSIDQQPITFDELAEMAEALGVDAERLVVNALRAWRDSNPQPSGWWPALRLVHSVKGDLTVDRRSRRARGWAA